MSAPEKIALSGLPRGELEALVERLLAENAALRRAVAELRAEVATLKGVKRRPGVKPSGMEKGTEPATVGTGRGRGAKAGKAGRLTIDEERVVAAEVPAGSRFKGYEDFLVQDLVLRPHVVRLRRERWLTPDGRTVVAPMPAGIAGHFGPELRRFVLAQYHQGQVTVPRLVAQLRAIGILISKRQVVRLLNAGQGAFLDEAREVLRTGLATAGWPPRAGHRGLATAGWPPRAGHRGLATAGWPPRAGHRGLATAGWPRRGGHRGLATAGWPPRAGHRGLATAGWPPRAGSASTTPAPATSTGTASAPSSATNTSPPSPPRARRAG